MTKDTEFGNLLRFWRQENRLSQTGLAERLRKQGYEGYDKSSISKWENGHTKPPAHVVATVEDILGTQPGLLLRAAGYRAEAEVRQSGFSDSEERAYSEQPTKETTSDTRMIKHLDELAETAKILAHHVRRLLIRRGDNDIEAHGDIITILRFWRKSTGQLITETIDPIQELVYAQQHRVDPYVAKCLFIHYEDKFGELSFSGWGDVTMENSDQTLLNNLLMLSHSEILSFCPSCPSCKALKKG